jgi:hypothetical protein
VTWNLLSERADEHVPHNLPHLAAEMMKSFFLSK